MTINPISMMPVIIPPQVSIDPKVNQAILDEATKSAVTVSIFETQKEFNTDFTQQAQASSRAAGPMQQIMDWLKELLLQLIDPNKPTPESPNTKDMALQGLVAQSPEVDLYKSVDILV